MRKGGKGEMERFCIEIPVTATGIGKCLVSKWNSERDLESACIILFGVMFKMSRGEQVTLLGKKKHHWAIILNSLHWIG